ncbi:DoxX family membrane protein [Corynebacterium poyangense]|uniref:DoxX family membrane protein n=1 Tax=Corynebacterium poyangense TaxID=2684405 RepID=A0A7H0SNH1_9CORY|nr:DoxX family protein [Corynebacterium poyangense]QNQ90096.1 DoxX family membrane protein [Corynebacterium poyangense]
MSDTSQSKPDRAIEGVDDEVPAYRPDKTTPLPRTEAAENDIYQRTGRVAPQVIRPAESEEQPTTAMERPTDSLPESAEPTVVETSQPTTELTAQPIERQYQPSPESSFDDTSEPLQSSENVTTATTVHDYGDDLPEYRRGTTDLGLLILRVLLAAWLLVDSLGAFFGLGGGGIGALQETFSAYREPHLLAIIIPSLELAAGVFLLFGLVTPLFAGLATVATVFRVVHAYAQNPLGFNPFHWEAPLMLAVLLASLAIALQFTGPGLYSLDGGRSWARRPLASSWLFVVLGVAAAVALWWFGAGTNPFN